MRSTARLRMSSCCFSSKVGACHESTPCKVWACHESTPCKVGACHEPTRCVAGLGRLLPHPRRAAVASIVAHNLIIISSPIERPGSGSASLRAVTCGRMLEDLFFSLWLLETPQNATTPRDVKNQQCDENPKVQSSYECDGESCQCEVDY